MTTNNIAEVARRANAVGYDKGFEAGSVAAANAIMAYLSFTGRVDVAGAIREAWETGVVGEFAGPPPEPAPADEQEAKPLDPPHAADTEVAAGEPGINKRNAQSYGFTGNSCNNCGSMQMVRNGTCEKCQSCGETTGCS